MSEAVEVYLEIGAKKTFACAVDWPGWCRSAKGEEAALEALTAYADRYGAVVSAAGHPLPKRLELVVVERVAGSGTTDFGAPGSVPDVDLTPLSDAVVRRTTDVLTAVWDYFDDVVAQAPAELRKGPRGGGRDRDAIAEHVFEAEASYARTLGVKGRSAAVTDAAVRAEMRAEVLDVIRARTDGQPVRPKGWPPRYAARRIAWHVLDHAWEIEDKS